MFNIESEVLTVVIVKSSVVWDVTLCVLLASCWFLAWLILQIFNIPFTNFFQCHVLAF
jgi:hypothetical protein